MIVASAVPYISRTRHRGFSLACDAGQDLVEDVKKARPTALRAAAELLSLHPVLLEEPWRDALLVPVPRSSMEQPPSNVLLADAIVRFGVAGSESVQALYRHTRVPSSRLQRRRRGDDAGVSYARHLETMAAVEGAVEPDEAVLLVDDLMSTGDTIAAAAETLRRAGHRGPVMGLALAYYVRDPADANCPVDFRLLPTRTR